MRRAAGRPHWRVSSSHEGCAIGCGRTRDWRCCVGVGGPARSDPGGAVCCTRPEAGRDCAKILASGLILAITAAAPPAVADPLSDVATELQAQGYHIVTVRKTWLGRIQIIAEKPDVRREIVIDRVTGEVRRDLVEEENPTVTTARPGTPRNHRPADQPRDRSVATGGPRWGAQSERSAGVRRRGREPWRRRAREPGPALPASRSGLRAGRASARTSARRRQGLPRAPGPIRVARRDLTSGRARPASARARSRPRATPRPRRRGDEFGQRWRCDRRRRPG